ncbi:hypothetical protein GCM10010954_09750 [Halobacillus andaensis]|uniref:DUF2515 domain-containing protein n=1 Tax=Halobacillus andaensis TaxID=1176239 RepID=A0A917EUA8_HALAA|nr:DUF2515 family protein [Halobacillus andaensis]MBP2003768.1 hypothetical protein [Halobacillus andaensis]GGF13089.1 hypothetical protein GCM10010954_09750 [Halobacillus andaensis]
MLKRTRQHIKQLKQSIAKSLTDHSHPPLPPDEKRIIENIRKATAANNQNNITRTQAYFNFYQNHPEIHWALLAHLVSRNAGWNMTDLKGEYLPKLLTEQEQVDFFAFLERGNWLIFQDAYPQLLLYEESKKQKRPLFHLLDPLNISNFMKPFWENMWSNERNEELTIALIINEQQYIEERVIHNSLYKDTVLDTIMFKLQDVFDFNHILFPYTTPLQQKTKLVGGTVHHFSSVEDRITLGKGLYDLLFSVQSRLTQTVNWAEAHPHTGSRKDYWPDLFNDVKETAPGQVHELKSSPCSLQVKTARIYSPSLPSVWKDWKHDKAEPGDWCHNKKMLHFIKHPIKQLSGDIEKTYCETIEELEMAAFTKNTFFHKK